MFHLWLAATRKSHYLRAALQKREEERDEDIVLALWQRWREKYIILRLKPLVSQALLLAECLLIIFAARHPGVSIRKEPSLPYIRLVACEDIRACQCHSPVCVSDVRSSRVLLSASNLRG